MCNLLGRNDMFPIMDIPPWESCFPAALKGFVEREVGVVKFQAGEIFNSCRAVEGAFLESLVNDIGVEKNKIWAVGPLHQTTLTRNELRRDQDKWLLDWLDKQEPNSVLYISFGTTTVFSEEEIKEIAIGLELSGVKFIWALREADKSVLSSTNEQGTQLPNGFEERMKGIGMGIVVREWVPQVEILGHSSTGGFMSHCGWNSCMESISMGVPLATWPLHSDQPINSLLITHVLKVGVAVMEWEQRDEAVSSSTIRRAVRTLMASNEGGEVRKRAEELGAEVRKSTEKGGVTLMEWDSFIAHITR